MCGRILYETQIAYPIRYGPYFLRLPGGRQGMCVICQDTTYSQYLQIIDWQLGETSPPFKLKGYLASAPILFEDGTIVLATLPDRQIAALSVDEGFYPQIDFYYEQIPARLVALLRGRDGIIALGIDGRYGLIEQRYDRGGRRLGSFRPLLERGDGRKHGVQISEQTVLLQWGRNWYLYFAPARKIFSPPEMQRGNQVVPVKGLVPTVAFTTMSGVLICTWKNHAWRCQEARRHNVSTVYAGSAMPIAPLFLGSFDPLQRESMISYYERGGYRTSIQLNHLRPKWIDGRRGLEHVYVLTHSKKHGTQLALLNFDTRRVVPCLNASGKVTDELLLADDFLAFASGKQLFVWATEIPTPSSGQKRSSPPKIQKRNLKIEIKVEARNKRVALNSTQAITITCRVASGEGTIRLLSVRDLAEASTRNKLYDFLPPTIIDRDLFALEKQANLQLVFRRSGLINVFIQLELLDNFGNRYTKRLEPLEFEVYDVRHQPPTYHFHAEGDMVVIQRTQVTDRDILSHR